MTKYETPSPVVPPSRRSSDIGVREAGEDLAFVSETLKHSVRVHAALDH